MEKCKTINKEGTNSQKGASPFPSLQDREEGDVVQDQIEEIASGEEVLHTLMLLPKYLLYSEELVNCHQRGQCPLSINEITHLPLKT